MGQISRIEIARAARLLAPLIALTASACTTVRVNGDVAHVYVGLGGVRIEPAPRADAILVSRNSVGLSTSETGATLGVDATSELRVYDPRACHLLIISKATAQQIADQLAKIGVVTAKSDVCGAKAGG